uniref:Uncharacterized protein n=1 Tax=Arundo donax TaxID=35708 RepID=A0A0A9BIK3_ARUDO
MSKMDVEHMGQENLSCFSISWKQCKCIVCPHRRTDVSRNESNRYCLIADGAVVLHRVLDAAVLVAQGRRVARSTLLAVEEVFLPSNSADAAIFAMVLLLVHVIVEEFARPAEVLPHANAAVAAHLRNRLLGVTDETDNRLNGVPVELVPVFRGLVMAMAAVEDVVAAGRADPAPPPVVLAPEAHPAEPTASLAVVLHRPC